MIRKHLEPLTIQLMPPSLQCKNHSCQLKVRCEIVALMVLELFGTKSHHHAQLLEHKIESKQRSIIAYNITQSALQDDKHRAYSMFGMQLQEETLTSIRPREQNSLPVEAGQRNCKIREIPHESPKIACKLQNATDIEYDLRPLSDHNRFNLLGIQCEPCGCDTRGTTKITNPNY